MKNQFKYISEISVIQFETDIVLPFIDEEGRSCVLIKNSKNKQNLITGSTDNLGYHLNSLVSKDNKNYYFHIITCLKSDGYSKEQFSIAYDYLFKSISEPQSDHDIGTLISSLEQLFKITPEQDRFKLHTGVYGELLFLISTYEHGCSEILNKYHSNFYSKHDIEIDRFNRIEIKSSVSPKRIHNFSHDQIFRNDVNVYVASILLEESSAGISLNELFNKVISYATEPNIELWLGQLKGYCGITAENPGPSFSYDKAIQDLKIFNAKDLPHVSTEIPNGITNIKYDVDCSLSDNIEFNYFLTAIKNLIK